MRRAAYKGGSKKLYIGNPHNIGFVTEKKPAKYVPR